MKKCNYEMNRISQKRKATMSVFNGKPCFRYLENFRRASYGETLYFIICGKYTNDKANCRIWCVKVKFH